MYDLCFRLTTESDPDLFQEQLNREIRDLDEDAVPVEAELSTHVSGGQVDYSALLHYKDAKLWEG